EQGYRVLSRDLQALLSAFVPKPKAFTLATSDRLPTVVKVPFYSWDSGEKQYEERPLRVRETTRDAFHDVKAILRLVDAGDIRVSEKTRRPTEASMKVI